MSPEGPWPPRGLRSYAPPRTFLRSLPPRSSRRKADTREERSILPNRDAAVQTLARDGPPPCVPESPTPGPDQGKPSLRSRRPPMSSLIIRRRVGPARLMLFGPLPHRQSVSTKPNQWARAPLGSPHARQNPTCTQACTLFLAALQRLEIDHESSSMCTFTFLVPSAEREVQTPRLPVSPRSERGPKVGNAATTPRTRFISDSPGSTCVDWPGSRACRSRVRRIGPACSTGRDPGDGPHVMRPSPRRGLHGAAELPMIGSQDDATRR